MKVLITGANGFLGKYLCQAFNGYEIDTIGLKDCDINLNLSIEIPHSCKHYNIVIHAAGKAHMLPKSSKEEEDFFRVNVDGTKNLIYGLENSTSLPEKLIFMSTVAVYGKETGWLIDETHPLEGSSHYAKSKIKAEEFLLEWGSIKGVDITVLRLPLLVGQNPPGNLGSMISAIRKGYYFSIGDGSARRSMVLADDVAQLIASNKIMSGIYNLTDGNHPSFRELELLITGQLNTKIKSIPKWLTKIACKLGDHVRLMPINSYKLEKLTSTLTFSDKKAREEMNWKPKSVIESFKI